MYLVIFHQVFWTTVSFLVFWSMIGFFLFPKLQKLKNKREESFLNLEQQIFSLNQKAQELKNLTYKILFEELPSNERFYIDKKLEPLLLDFKLKIQDEAEFFKKKLEKYQHHGYYKLLSHDISVKDALNVHIESFLKRIGD